MPSRIVSREPWGWYMKAPPLSSPSSPLPLLLLRLFLFPILNPAVKIHHWSGHICRRSSVFSNVEREEHFRSVPNHLFTSSVSLRLSPSPSFFPPRLSSPRWRPCAKHAAVDIFQFHFQSVPSEKDTLPRLGLFFRHVFFLCGAEGVDGWMVGWSACKSSWTQHFLIPRHVSRNSGPHTPTQSSAPWPLLTRPLKQNSFLAVIYLFIF